MRDPNRIPPLLYEVGKLWMKVPDQRFGQLLVNYLLTGNIDPFYVEDDEMLTRIKEANKAIKKARPLKKAKKKELAKMLVELFTAPNLDKYETLKKWEEKHDK